MRANISKELQAKVLDGLALSPLEREAGRVYAKYDTMVISANKVEFHYDGKPVFYFKHEARFELGDVVSLTDLPGRMEMCLTNS